MYNFPPNIFVVWGTPKSAALTTTFPPPAHTSTGSARAAPAPPTQILQMSRLGVSATHHGGGGRPAHSALETLRLCSGRAECATLEGGRSCRDLVWDEGEGEGDVWVAIEEALPGSGADFLGGFDYGGLVDGENLAVSH